MTLRMFFGLARGSVAVLILGAASSSTALVERPIVPVQTHSVASSDGVRIVYDTRGREDAALVFVHCWACNRLFWRDQVDVFSAHYRVVTLDLAGHGESGKNRKPWTVLGLAQDVVAVADDLKLKRIVLVGHSMGGPVSLEAARLLRGRAVGVVLVDTVHNVDERKSVASAQADADQLKQNFTGYFSDLSALFSKTSDPAIREWVQKQAMSADPDAVVALKLDMPTLDYKLLFENAAVPIRAINAQPPLTDGPTNIEENKKYANYDATLVGDAGHFVQLERPEEFNRDLQKWLVELSH